MDFNVVAGAEAKQSARPADPASDPGTAPDSC